MNASALSSPVRHTSTKPQYLLSFAVIGCITPFLSVYLRQRGLTEEQAANVWALASLGTIVTPILITLLADTAIAGKYLMAASFALAGLFLAAMLPAYGFVAIATLYTLHSLVIRPIFPLQDGIHFSAQAQRAATGLREIPYYAIRVWGSVGYILPGLILYLFLNASTSLTPTIVGGILCCLIGTIYSIFFLPCTPPPPRGQARSRLPTMDAARALFEPHMLVFCIAMFLLQASSAAYYYGYPIQLVQRCGLGNQWVGPIAAIGVILETLYILSFGRLVQWLTLRRLMWVGAFVLAIRMFILAAFPDAVITIATQAIHGLTVIVVGVAPPIYLNERARNEYRNSIQGLYQMAFTGTGQIAGYFLTGKLAQHGLATAFNVSGALGLVGMLLLLFCFEERHRPRSA